MHLVTDTPLAVGWRTWAFSPGDMRLVVAVKATFELPSEGLAQLVADVDQAFVTGDEPWDDDVDRTIRYASDLALVKPQGEAWLTGTLSTPEPVRELVCRARVGDVEMRFSVVGDRWWEPSGAMSAPAPFRSMELSWERAFGGPGFAANPAGRGIAPDPNDAAGRVALPNIELHDRLVRSPAERPEPAGAFPIPPTWPERAQLMGTYDASYMRERWPYYPADFSWRHFQAARPAQRIEGYWRGDEEIELAHLHPSHARVHCRLPSIKPRAFVREAAQRDALREIGLVLDTITIDAGQGRAFAVWRGSTACSGEALEELSHLYVLHEALDAARKPAEYLGSFVARLRAMHEEEHGFAAEEPPPSLPHRGAPEPARVENELKRPTPEQLVDEQRQAAFERRWPAEVVEELFPKDLDASTDDPQARDAQRTRLQTTIAMAAELGLEPEAVEALRNIEASFEPVEEEAPDAAEPKRGAQPPPGMWTSQELRERVQRMLEAGESLVGLNAAEADLSLLDLSGQDLTGAILTKADLRSANLDGAVLDEAVLDEAVLEGATLRGTSLRGASLALSQADRADFTEANLEGVRMERATLAGAVLRKVRAGDASIEECLCTGADLQEARLERAILRRSNFDEADLWRAKMSEAAVQGASFRLARLDHVDAPNLRAGDDADFSEARMRWATFEGSSFAASVLIGTKFAESNLTRTSFVAARLEGAELLAVRARAAVFTNASMSGASLAGADLLGARFEGAQLRLADLSNANLYQAELWRADVSQARLDGANVEGTKLA